MLDMTLAEFEQLVNIVDDIAEEERIVMVYEPYPDRWSADFRRRRR